MLTPGLAKLFEPLSVVSAATHSVKILRNKGMVAVRQSKPIHVDRPFVAGIGSQRESHAAIYCATVQLRQADQPADDDVGAGDIPPARLVQRWQSRGFDIAVLVDVYDLDGLHRRADRNLARDRTSIRRAAKRLGEFRRNYEAAAGDAERPRFGLIIILVPFDLKKRESSLGVAYRQIERRVWRKFFDDELFERCGEPSGKLWNRLGFGDECH